MNKLNLKALKISDFEVGPQNPPFLIAEIGINHNGDMELAKKMILAAKKSGASAVKFQSWQTSKLTAKKSSQTTKNKDDLGCNDEIYELFKKVEFKKNQHFEINDFCKKNEIIFMSTVFDEEGLSLLEEINVPAHKIASMDLNYTDLIRKVAKTQKPIIISTGMGTLGEIEKAQEICLSEGNEKIIFLHCVSNYPPKIEDCNLLAMETIRDTFNVLVGYSDHTIGTDIPLAAISLGACLIEKHFTLDKTMPGPDQAVSADPEDLSQISQKSKAIVAALGSPIKKPVLAELEMISLSRRSAIVNRAINKGEIFTENMIDLKRPGNGFSPQEIKMIIGRKSTSDLTEDTLILPEHLGELG
jgi:N,N'-diacetyllegionaminate synthase